MTIASAGQARVFKSTGVGGLDFESFPMRLFQKAKKFGIWDPQSFDFSKDRADWESFTPEQREVLLHLSSLFLGGEESVTLDLLPLIGVVAEEGRLEEEMYLTSFLWEEAKHVEVFRRFLDEVARDSSDLTRFHGPSYQAIFYQELPGALGRLRKDPSPVAQAEASVTYNLIVEGVLAETGYHAYFQMLEANDVMPAMREVVGKLKQDESRHLAYGVYLLSRLVAEHGDEVWEAIDRRMNHLLPLALGMIDEMFAAYDELPFGLSMDDFVTFATTQFQKRYERVAKAREQDLEEIVGT
ncbi:R2-like ligand-binding oxidase [Lujinxingia sediminis]|uniref:R2-like ligand binding oxidase n=1 Tax=Lujinxingia sediminis TaxID=2480984 RepID=A0ABY0CX98_9DELT|nr:R2-like ligand-binding oxidase [Lujinxingia sediminis]RVU48045.1 R2-like ligand-binding oxidase [Lujinxingia sediminis]